jgi:hypothetical protein
MVRQYCSHLIYYQKSKNYVINLQW